MSSTSTGRRTQTRGLSMHPHELDDVRTIEELTGVGFSQLYHRHLAPQVHAAAQLLLDARDAGLQLDRTRLLTEWDLTTSPSELFALYGEESELSLGE